MNEPADHRGDGIPVRVGGKYVDRDGARWECSGRSGDSFCLLSDKKDCHRDRRWVTANGVGIHAPWVPLVREIGPYDGFQPGEVVMARQRNGNWEVGIFSGVNDEGRPIASTGPYNMRGGAWKECRRPTPEELGK